MKSILRFFAFRNSAGTGKRALVNASDQVQAEIVTSALPSGAATEAKQDIGNSSLSILDDWDEADRAKVNPIVGEAGVEAGAGISTTKTQRIAIASNANVVDTELPAAAALADGASATPTTPTVGAIILGMPSNGSATVDRAKLSKAHDVDSGAGTEYAAGVSLRKTASGGSVELGTATDPIRTDPTGTTTQPVSAASLPLPTGAATAARQDTGNTSLASLETKIGEVQASPTANTVLDRLKALLTELQLKADLAETQPVSVASLPLPSGAATSANQTTEITALQLIDDIVHAMNGAFSKSAAIGGHLNDTTPTAATEGNVAPVRITEQRALHINLRGDDGTELPWGGAPLADGLGVIAGGEKSGGGFEYFRNEQNPTTGEYGLNVNVMPYDSPLWVEGRKQNNNEVPGSTNLGTLPAVANAAAPTQTEGRQVALRATLSGDLVVSLDGEVVAVTVASLPLPAGAATEAKQDVGNASLSVMDDWDEADRAKVNPIAGQAGVQGGAGAVTALTQRVAIATDANVVDTELPAAAALAENMANPTAPAVAAHLMALDGATWDRVTSEAPADYLTGISGTTKGLRVISCVAQRWSSDHEDTPTGTNNYYGQGMNDRGDLLASISGIRNNPAEIGHGTTEAVGNTYPTNQRGAQRVAQAGAKTATLTNVNDQATSVQLLAANTARAGAIFWNDSASILYIKFGTTASLTSCTVPIAAGAIYELPMPVYTGRIDGIWSADAAGAVRITELT